MKNIVSLRNKSNDQLNDRLNEINISLRRMRQYKAIQSTELGSPSTHDTAYMSRLRKEKARILTILNERRERKRHKK